MVSTDGSGTPGSRPPGRVTSTGRRAAGRGRWDLGTRDAESVLAEARTAFFVMAGVLAVLWIIQTVNWAGHYQLTLDYGIGWQAHIGGLVGGVTAGWIFRDRRPKPGKTVPATGSAGLNIPGTARRTGEPGGSAP